MLTTSRRASLSVRTLASVAALLWLWQQHSLLPCHSSQQAVSDRLCSRPACAESPRVACTFAAGADATSLAVTCRNGSPEEQQGTLTLRHSFAGESVDTTATIRVAPGSGDDECAPSWACQGGFFSMRRGCVACCTPEDCPSRSYCEVGPGSLGRGVQSWRDCLPEGVCAGWDTDRYRPPCSLDARCPGEWFCPWGTEDAPYLCMGCCGEYEKPSQRSYGPYCDAPAAPPAV
jgi:hypothetical protein